PKGPVNRSLAPTYPPFLGCSRGCSCARAWSRSGVIAQGAHRYNIQRALLYVEAQEVRVLGTRARSAPSFPRVARDHRSNIPCRLLRGKSLDFPILYLQVFRENTSLETTTDPWVARICSMIWRCGAGYLRVGGASVRVFDAGRILQIFFRNFNSAWVDDAGVIALQEIRGEDASENISQ